MQGLKLVYEGGATVSFESLVSTKRKKITLRDQLVQIHSLHVEYLWSQKNVHTHPFLQVAIPTSVSFMPTPEKQQIT